VAALREHVEASGAPATHGGCCPSATVEPAPAIDPASLDEASEFAPYIGTQAGVHTLHFLVDGIHCGGCIQRIERTLAADPIVDRARVNLSTKRLTLAWRGAVGNANRLVKAVEALGYRLVAYDPAKLETSAGSEERTLLRAMAVAGFAAGNVMLLSVAVWAGAVQDMGPATRDLLHWISALIALPAAAYAGRPFFRAAYTALSHRRLSMEVPISLAVVAALAMSLFETINSGGHVYFDSACALLFFLLIGRYLDRRARGRARSAAAQLLGLAARAVTVIAPDGQQQRLAPDRVRTGMTVLVAAGERVGVDGTLESGAGVVDTSLITGEAMPATIAPGDRVFAGTMNLADPMRLSVSAVGGDTLLAEIVRLTEAAETERTRYEAIADRVARIYAPAVHGLGAASFLGWYLIGGVGWQPALLTAISVLIITCPCALGLAVPMVQAVTSGRLLRRGVIVKSGTALERLARIDRVIFDKTGTLTKGAPQPVLEGLSAADLDLAASLAATSRHPLARGLADAHPAAKAASGVREVPGMGLEAYVDGDWVRLGSRAWCSVPEDEAQAEAELWLRRGRADAIRIPFVDALRDDAATVVGDLQRRGFEVALLSGDRAATVAAVADSLGVDRWQAACRPDQKAAALAASTREGHRVLMVGDGINDAPALAGAFVSMSPASGADVSQAAADLVFQGAHLSPVGETISLARRAAIVVRQNFGLALLYNAVTIPIAMAGFVSPLVAAIAMSASSLVVVANALRLGRGSLR
jgi:Cu2+-exporting ATPase